MRAPIIFLSLFALTSAQGQDLTTDQQIAGAVSPAPEEMRAGATVYALAADGMVTTLREGTNDLICMADEPGDDRFHAACYHESLEPFMTRGRELRAEGMSRDEVNRIREEEARSGHLEMPPQAALYSLSGPAGSFDPATGAVTGASKLYVVYIPYATAESTGLSPAPGPGKPWLMDAGKPWAHIMLQAGVEQ